MLQVMPEPWRHGEVNELEVFRQLCDGPHAEHDPGHRRMSERKLTSVTPAARYDRASSSSSSFASATRTCTERRI